MGAHPLALFQQLDDLRREDEALFDRVPDFVPWAVLGTFVTFTTFTFPQWYYQYVTPGAPPALTVTVHY